MEPITFVVFGATGDLAQRKIMPALFRLFQSGTFSKDSQIICFSRRPWSDEAYRTFITPSLPEGSADFLSQVEYCEGTFDTTVAFQNLKTKIKHTNVLYHLAIQSDFYETTITSLGETGHHGKVLIEKPFGHDLISAQALEKHIEKYFAADQVFLIDHYLGKEGLAAVVAERIADTKLEEKLSNTFVSRTEVHLLESLDIQGRGEFYDATGALRDVGQNHVLEMLATALVGLIEAQKNIPQARTTVLQSLVTPLSEKNIRGQYVGYTSEHAVSENSQTETYFRIETQSTLDRWQGVPIILEGGKALKEKQSNIIFYFTDGTKKIFDIEIPKTKDAYEIVIAAAIVNDRSIFVSREEMIASWKFITPLITLLAKTPLYLYEKGNFPIKISE